MNELEAEQESYGFESPLTEALNLVRASNGEGLYASADVLFKGAVFGRDSLTCGRDILYVKPELSHEIILTMARLQGVRRCNLNEEEIGKIVHEKRVDKNLDHTSKVIFEELTSVDGKNWGKEWSEEDQSWRMVYYGSVDATPAYIQLVSEYVDYKGPDILDERIVRRDDQEITVRQSVLEALKWTLDKLDNSKSGLLCYRRINPTGIENQVWKDSKEFYVHRDGTDVNHDDEIASIEVQGLVYDALNGASVLFPDMGSILTQKAEELKAKTLDLFWLEEEGYFGVAVDIDNEGRFRTVQTKSANAASLLDGRFFDGMEEANKQKYVSSIVKSIMGDDFLTDAGIRSRSLRESHLVPFWDYHGCYAVWPKETYTVIRGLRHQGFSKLAEQLENRMLNSVRRSDGFPELMYVDGAGQVLLGDPVSDTEQAIIVPGSNKPEHIQAWTITPVMAVLTDRMYGPVEVPVQTLWQSSLEATIMQNIKHIPFYNNREDLNTNYPYLPYILANDYSFGPHAKVQKAA